MKTKNAVLYSILTVAMLFFGSVTTAQAATTSKCVVRHTHKAIGHSCSKQRAAAIVMSRTRKAERIIRRRSEVIAFLKEFNAKEGRSPSIGGVPVVEVDHHQGVIYSVHVYELVPARGEDPGHTATFDWYEVNVITEKVDTLFDIAVRENNGVK